MESTYIIGFLSAIIVMTELFVRKTFLKQLRNGAFGHPVHRPFCKSGLIADRLNRSCPRTRVWTSFSQPFAPLAIFWLLLPVNLRNIFRAGKEMIVMFLVGSMATAIGVFIGMWAINGSESIGPLYYAIGGMFVGTYTGGSVNFNTLGLEYNVMKDGLLYGGSIVVDNIITTVWMIVTLAVPRLISHVWPRKPGTEIADYIGEVKTGEEEDTETIHPVDFGLVLALGFGAVWLSNRIAIFLPDIPSALIPYRYSPPSGSNPERFSTSRPKGDRDVLPCILFLCVIGAYCDVGALSELGGLGVSLLIFTTITVTVHGMLVYSVAYFFKINPVVASVASQANVGGGPSALALARSLGREDLVLPAILVGSLGYAVGTFLGLWVAEGWLPLIG